MHQDAVPFGDENATKEEVYAFYKDWEGFTSIKKFAYVDVYDSRDAPNRRIKRLIEVDNNRARNRERNKFNDKVRDLLEHVKSKDPRFKAYQAEDKRIREERKRQQEVARAQKEAEHEERLRRHREELAEHNRKLEEEAELHGEVDEVIEEEFVCRLCKNKSFKT